MIRRGVCLLAIGAALATCFAGRLAAAADEPPAFGEVCFDDFDYTEGFVTQDELRELLEPVPGKESQIKTDRNFNSNRTNCRIAGSFRLRPEWQADSMLRMSIEIPDWGKQLRVQFWTGDRGVILRCYREAQLTWMAYGVTRSGREPTPETYAHWGCDSGRYPRSKGSTVEIRFQDGHLVLSRGDLLLICVPFEGLPSEVYVDGTAAVRGLAMLRSGPMRLEPPPVRPTIVGGDRPAELPWKLSQQQGKSGASLERLPDGGVELKAPAKSGEARAKGLNFPPGLYEFIFQMDGAEPGTGIYFAADDGRELAKLDFFRDSATGQTGFALPESWHPPTGVSFAGRRQWIRVVMGAGMAHCSVSGDGVFWSERCPQRCRIGDGACASIGLYAKATDKNLAIGLRRVEVRRLDGVMSLVPPAVWQRAVLPTKIKDLADWEQAIAGQRPDDVPAAMWRRACILRALSENAAALPSDKLLGELAEAAITDGGDLKSVWNTLDEICLLSSVADYHSAAQSYYLRWGKELVRRGDPDSCRTVRNAVLRMPAWTVDADVFSPGLVHRELQEMAQTARWDDVGEFCRQFRYWLRFSEAPFSGFPWSSDLGASAYLLRWSESQAARYGRKVGTPGRAAASLAVRDPVIERLGKESYNVLGEFEAAMETASYREAAQTICNMSTAQGLGLVSDVKDPQLLVSLPITIERRMQETPELRKAMRMHFGELGQLRRREAIADDDPAAVEAITFQFPGTEAAAAAHAWLGDREFSMGHVAQAASHYREALPDLVPTYRGEALARLRLAEALRGHDVGQPVTAPVNLGEVRMEAAEFEQLVGSLREARARLRDPANLEQENAASSVCCPAAGRYDVKPWARITCRDDVMPEGLERCDRRFAAVISGNQMIVTDQVRQTAIDLKTSHIRWQQKKPAPVVPLDKKQAADSAKEKQKDKEQAKKPPPPPADFRWSLAPMTPLVDHGRVYARRLSDQQGELVCLDAANGKPLWSGEAVGSAVSNVLLIGQELLTIAAKQPLSGQLDMVLAGFDPASGQMQSQAPLADFRDYCNRALHCRAVAVENKIIASVGGTVICGDLPGRVRWLRRQIFVPPPYVSSPNELKAALLWHQQTYGPPLVVDGRVYVTQPGVWAVECLNVDNGRLIWRQPLPEITGLAGRIDQRLVVGATDGLLALDAQTGKIVWRCEIPDRLDPILCGSPGGILCMKLEAAHDAKAARRPVLVWLAPETGEVVKECILEPPTEGATVCGPIITSADRQWLIFTVPDKPDVRDIVELVGAKETAE